MPFHIDAPFNPCFGLTGLPFELSGWCFWRDEAARLVEVRLDGSLSGVEPFTHPRPDVAAAFADAKHLARPLGVSRYLDWPEDLARGSHELALTFVGESGRRETVPPILCELQEAGPARGWASFPAVPPHLVRKVNGFPDEASFRTAGQGLAEVIDRSLAGRVSRARNILDFGCGLGRVLSPLMARAPEANFTGCDADPWMLRWCEQLLDRPRCRLVPSTRDLADGQFDVIYAVSVFTHLDSTAAYWLSELARLLAPDGRAFLTYHDESLFHEVAGGPLLPGVAAGAAFDHRFVSGTDVTEGGAGLGVYISTERWERWLAEYSTVEETVPRGLLGFQSYSIVSGGRANPRRTERGYIRWLEEELARARARHRETF